MTQDKSGRKQLLVISFLGMALSMLAISAGLVLPQLAVSLMSTSDSLKPQQ